MPGTILPVVKLCFPCERAELSADVGAYVITNPLSAIALPARTGSYYQLANFACYAQLSGGLGTYNFSAAVLHESSDRVFYRTKPVVQTFPPKGRIVAYDFAIPMPAVRVLGIGFYRLQLLCEQKPLPEGEVPLRILEGV